MREGKQGENVVTKEEIAHINHAVGAIQDAIAGIKTIKNAMGMTDESHIEKDLRVAIRTLMIIGVE